MAAFRAFGRALRTGYQRIFRREEDTRLREIVATLRQVPLFQGLSGSALREVAEIMHQRTYRREEFLFYEDDPGLGLYVIQRGRVRLLTEEDSNAVHELRQVAEHEYFGELSLLGGFRRLESAQAVTETQVLGFFRPDLRVLLKRRPHTGAAFVMALAETLAGRQISIAQALAEDNGRTAALRRLDEVVAQDAGMR